MDYRNFNPCVDPNCVNCTREYYRSPPWEEEVKVPTFSPGSRVKAGCSSGLTAEVKKGDVYTVQSTIWDGWLNKDERVYLKEVSSVYGAYPADWFRAIAGQGREGDTVRFITTLKGAVRELTIALMSQKSWETPVSRSQLALLLNAANLVIALADEPCLEPDACGTEPERQCATCRARGAVAL